MSEMLDNFGLEVDEILSLNQEAQSFLASERLQWADEIVEDASIDLAKRIHAAMSSELSAILSDTGKKTFILEIQRMANSQLNRHELLRLFANPPLVKSLPVWCFIFAVLDASVAFQLDVCQKPQSENILTGRLIECLSSACKVWTKVAAVPMSRVGAALLLSSVDLSIGGGEQRTGGDFALVLELQTVGFQLPVRTIPIIFQAKRYVRPTADVSQHHPTRGYQHTALGGNKCASSYILYENAAEAEIDEPLPALVKVVSDVGTPSWTNVIKDSVDLPSFLLKNFHSMSTPTAKDAEDALRMIDEEFGIERLAFLAVISSDSQANLRYEIGLARRRERRLRDSDARPSGEDGPQP